jgi:phosphoribosylanthranilate isomerase
MKIKVCGLKDASNITQVANLSPGYMGFIFYDKTPRFAGNLSASALKKLPPQIVKTAVFVNEGAENIKALITRYKFDAIQLHGNEGPEVCALLKGNVKVIKAFGLNEDFDFDQLYPYADHVDFFLFDAKTELYGGSGKTFDWDILNDYDLDIPFFLSGGISPDNLEEIKNIQHPQFYGVDLNSRFETGPGIKNIEQLKKAFAIIKQFDNHEIRS